MDDISVFTNKELQPTEGELKNKLDSTYGLWLQIRDFVAAKVPEGVQEWNFPGKKYGWSYRIKDKRRAIIYLLPREGYFAVAFVFGEKAFRDILQSEIADPIKESLRSARKYAEGRGIRIDVSETSILNEIKKLVEIKLKY
jgi:hypothetical protein